MIKPHSTKRRTTEFDASSARVLALVNEQYGGGTHDRVAMEGLLILIAELRVGKRPGRIEPRALKRRQKQFPLLTQLRQDARKDVRKNGHQKKQR